MMKQKEKFKQFLRKDYSLEWPLSNIKAYEFKDKEAPKPTVKQGLNRLVTM